MHVLQPHLFMCMYHIFPFHGFKYACLSKALVKQICFANVVNHILAAVKPLLCGLSYCLYMENMIQM